MARQMDAEDMAVGDGTTMNASEPLEVNAVKHRMILSLQASILTASFSMSKRTSPLPASV